MLDNTDISNILYKDKKNKDSSNGKKNGHKKDKYLGDTDNSDNSDNTTETVYNGDGFTTTIPEPDHKITAFASIPTDTYFGLQWHLDNTGQSGGTVGVDLNVTNVWDTYKGAGIKIAIADDGVDYTHSDLSENYDHTLDWDSVDNDDDASTESALNDRHGTAVAGVIAGDENGTGIVGVASEASISALRIGFEENGTIGQINDATSRYVNFDVVNNSWGYTSPFADDFNNIWYSTMSDNITDAVNNGRGGLGTNIVFAAGNDRAFGDDVNYHSLQNSPFTIAVGALTRTGVYSEFSTPGAAVLVSAPGTYIVTSDNVGAEGYVGSDYVGINGTSFSAPGVSGVIALMLDANADLW